MFVFSLVLLKVLLVKVISTEEYGYAFVETPYQIESGPFVLLEQSEKSIYINEYPAFHSTHVIPLCKYSIIN